MFYTIFNCQNNNKKKLTFFMNQVVIYSQLARHGGYGGLVLGGALFCEHQLDLQL